MPKRDDVSPSRKIHRHPPLGAHWSGNSTDFRVFSAHAEVVELCLFESSDGLSERRVAMNRDGDIWHKSLPNAGPGTYYGYRAHGRFAPQDGMLFNGSKLLIDPYARAVTGEPAADPSVFGFRLDQNPRHSFDSRDSASAMPKCVVVDDAFDWQGVEKPRVPWAETVLYECHVRGFTRLHPEVPESLRGTYLGLVHPPVLDHLRRLGVTAVELLPVFQSAPEAHLLAQGKRNYWGYSPVSFFAPNAHYARRTDGGQVAEFKTMVRELHRAGLEVILDVVFNHTAEGGLKGPIYGLKGLDALSYYWLRRGLPGRWIDVTGCGNTLDIGKPAVLRLALDSLRYWVREMGVDGFRFDLATVMGRDGDDFDANSSFFRAVREDPDLAEVKWIAEPWDLGSHGYRLGQFPAEWSEWNDRFRDATRRFWRGEAHGALTAELASRISGSEDIFQSKSRGSSASINYVISHDGFTLKDWVSYERKHNEANGELNRDGTDNNLSRNWGHEGPTEDPRINALRNRARRNVVATLLLSRGAPMLQHGDEIGRTQRGNNNPYCQDNEIAWTHWREIDTDFFEVVAELIRLRRRYPQLRSKVPSVDERWLRVDGGPMAEEDWRHPDLRTLVWWLPSSGSKSDVGEGGLLVAWHGGLEAVTLGLPDPPSIDGWRVLFCSAEENRLEREEPLSQNLWLPALSVTVLERVEAEQDKEASRE